MALRSIEIGGEPQDQVRLVGEVLDRTLSLGAAVAVSFGAPADEIQSWLTEEGLVFCLSENERVFFSDEGASEQQVVNMTWQSERLTVLLWALGMLDALPPPFEKCDSELLETMLPPFGDKSLDDFRKSAVLRSEDELFDMAFELQEHHVVARKRKRLPAYRPGSEAVDIEVIRERHHAINWLVGYSGQAWDEVTTDT